MKDFGKQSPNSKDAPQGTQQSLSSSKAVDTRENKEVYHYRNPEVLKEEQDWFSRMCYFENLT